MMNDQELIKFVGLADASEKMQQKFLAQLTQGQRDLYNSMATLEDEVVAWQEGRGPKPRNAIICGCGHSHEGDGE